MQTYQTMTAAVMQITIPVTSPPRYTPTSIATFDVSCSLASCGSGATVGFGCSTGSSGATVGRGCSTGSLGATVGLGCSTGSSGATVGRGSSTCDSGVQIVGLGFSTSDSGVEVGLGCGSGVQEGLHTLTMVAVRLPTDITVLVLAALS